MSDCLQDVLISELPRIDDFSYDDLLVLDVKKVGQDIFETHAITWGHLSGVYPPGSGSGGGGGNGGDEIDNEIILRGQVKFLDGTELRPSITFIKDSNTGFYRPRDNSIGVTTGGSRVMVWSDQRVGINTDFPEEMLHLQEGNLLIRLGDNLNDMYLGSSTRTIGGDPSVQSVGTAPLTFHVNRSEWLRINQYGAFGLRFGILIDFGKDNWLITSQGPDKPVIWKAPEDVIDINKIIDELSKFVGKGEIDLHSEGTHNIDGPGIGSNPSDFVEMSSGIDVQTLMGGGNLPIVDPNTGLPIQDANSLEHPSANSYDNTGWYVKLDESVVRTDGYQVVHNKKLFDGEVQIRNTGNLKIFNDGNISFSTINYLPRRN